MSGIKDFGGFGTENTEEGTEDFESSTAGGNGHTDDSTPRDDHSDDVGWDQTTDVKSIEGVGKEPTDDKDKNEDKGTGADKDKPAPKAKENGEEGDNEGDDDKGDELPEGVKRRVSRVQRQRDQAREEAEALRKENAELKAAKAKAEDAPKDAPKAEDFDDYEDYLQAKKDHEAKPAPKKEEPKPDTGADTLPAETKAAIRNAQVELKASLVDAGTPELFEAVGKLDINITPDMLFAIADGDAIENPESVMQAFLDKPDLANEIAALKTPAARMKRLAALDVPYVKPDEKNGDEAKDKKPAPPKKGSDAPDPIGETNGNAHGDAGYDGLSFNEFEKKRNSEERASKDFW